MMVGGLDAGVFVVLISRHDMPRTHPTFVLMERLNNRREARKAKMKCFRAKTDKMWLG